MSDRVGGLSRGFLPRGSAPRGLAPIYRGQNLYAASLTDGAYAHQPQFLAFRDKGGPPFKAFPIFGKAEQAQRRELVQKLVETIWSPERLTTVLPLVAVA